MSQLSEQILEKVDLYLTDNLSPIDKTQFESEIASNSVLREEVDFQKDVVNSIKENRRLELKSRLQNIEVSSKSKWMSKNFFGGVAATVVLGLIGFSYYEYTKNDNNPDLTAQNRIFITDFKAQDNNIATIDDIKNPTYLTEETEKITEEKEENTDIDLENINVPNLEINTTDEQNVSNNSLATLDDLESVEIMNSGAVNVEIEFKNPNSKHLAYKFYDQKLYLFGKFNTKNPYEVIEINTKFGKEFYLKFDKSYYTIENGMVDKTPLFKVDNSKLIKKLEELN